MSKKLSREEIEARLKAMQADGEEHDVAALKRLQAETAGRKKEEDDYMQGARPTKTDAHNSSSKPAFSLVLELPTAFARSAGK